MNKDNTNKEQNTGGEEKKELGAEIGYVRPRDITIEMQESYMDYAMSVIVGRALPDVRDGLKPVHRRILYAMKEDGITHNAKYRKSASVVGSTLARYHPHGDMAVYHSMVLMAQDFSMRYPLVQGQGNFGSVDGDPPSAMRYSEARLSKMGEMMLQDIQKETVDFISNYDGTKKEPTVLPSPVPQLLLNGSLGIAVGMATNIPPHNIGEIVDATVHLIENPKADTEDLFQFVKGPDFPTGGEIYNKEDIISAYSQGRGSITIRGKAEVVEEKGKTQIIITEIPYRVRKAKLVQDFAKLVQKKKLDGIKDIRDESDREGMRIVFDLKSSAYPRKILNRLYSFSSLQEKFHLNMIALIDGIQPRVMGLAELLRYYIDHRNQVIIRRTKFDLQKAKDRAHILEGLYKALSHIDEIIKTIKGSENKENAKQNLIKKFEFTEIQADAILEMKLQKLAKMEKKEIEDELKEKQAIIKKLTAILASDKKIMDIVKKELLEMKEMFNDERRTKVNEKGLKKVDDLDLIPQEPTIVTITQGGYIKRINPATYKAQKRGGKGMLGMKTGKEDVVDHFIEAMTHDFLLFFTDSGKVFRIPVYQIPEGVRTARGRGLLNFLEISPEEKVLAVIPLEKEETVSDKNLIIITKKGIIKKTQLKEFINIRRSGLIAITLKEGDEVCRVRKTSGSDEIAIATKKGKLIRFNEKEVRAMGRQAGGVRGINIKEKDDGVADVSIIEKESVDGSYLLIMTKNGYGKRIKTKSYRAQKRGGMGVKTVKNTKKIGEVAALRTLTIESDVMMVSQKGKVIRVNLSNIPVQSRITQGARMMRLNKGDKLVSVICI
jgi:DNA gyrase subunit A